MVETISRHSVTESSAGVYTEGVWTPIEKLRLTAGFRGDYYDFDVNARLEGADAGAPSDDALLPKAGVAYAFNDRVEVYGNWGRGFHRTTAEGCELGDAGARVALAM